MKESPATTTSTTTTTSSSTTQRSSSLRYCTASVAAAGLILMIVAGVAVGVSLVVTRNDKNNRQVASLGRGNGKNGTSSSPPNNQNNETTFNIFGNHDTIPQDADVTSHWPHGNETTDSSETLNDETHSTPPVPPPVVVSVNNDEDSVNATTIPDEDDPEIVNATEHSPTEINNDTLTTATSTSSTTSNTIVNATSSATMEAPPLVSNTTAATSATQSTMPATGTTTNQPQTQGPPIATTENVLPNTQVSPATTPPPPITTTTPSATTTTTTTMPTQNDPPLLQYGLQPDCHDNDLTRYNICLDVTSTSGQVEDWFVPLQKARLRWERIITADVRPTGWPIAWIASQGPDYIATILPTDNIDDLYVSVMVQELDNNFFAMAGPTRYGRNQDSTAFQVAAGRIQINQRRLGRAMSAGYFENLMLHEIGHILGLGILWDDWQLIERAENGQITYTGTHGLQAWRDLGCSGPLPVVANGFHWNEQCILHEVMNPNFYQHHKELFSMLSMGSLQDMGYVVNVSEADPMGLSDLVASACGAWCAEATGRRRRQRRLGRKDVPPRLSDEAELKILQAAANHFKSLPPQVDFSLGDGEDLRVLSPQVVSILYEENNHFFGRIVHKRDTEHL